MNERAISIEDEIELPNLYSDFAFRERQKQLYFFLFCDSFHLGAHAFSVCLVHVVTS